MEREPATPVERRETPRQALERHLARDAFTPRELAGLLGLPERDVVDHLEHLERSLRRSGRRLLVEPARCRACGYVFERRRRLGRPSGCPDCRKRRIEPPRYRIQDRGGPD